MANRDTIKSFLVDLGFKVDESQMSKFRQGIETATKAVVALGIAVEGMALAVAVGVARYASTLDALYFASQRTNTSVLNLKALGIAAQNTGSNANEAQGAIESLAAFMRNNPGGEGWLQSALGVDTEDANGKLRDTSDILIDIGKAFSEMSTARAHQSAQFLGLPDNIMLALRNGTLATELNKARDALKGVDFEDAARRARELDESLSRIQARFDAIKTKLEGGLLKKFQPELDAFGDWLDAHSDQIIKLAGNFADDVALAGTIIIPILNKIAEGWRDIYQAMKDVGEWIADHLPDSASDFIGKRVGEMLDWFGIRKQVDEMMGNGNTDNLPDPDQPAPTATPQAGASGQRKRLASGQAGRPDTPDTPPDLSRVGLDFRRWLRNLVDSVVPPDERVTEHLQQWGASRAQAEGIVENLKDESGLNPSAVGDHGLAYGIAQWHKAGQDAFKQWAGIDIRGSSLNDQLAFLEHDLDTRERVARNLLLNANTKQQATEIFSLKYERPAGGVAEAERRAGATVTMNQHTQVHVTGGDAHEAGRNVAAAQKNVNAELTRNLISAVN